MTILPLLDHTYLQLNHLILQQIEILGHIPVCVHYKQGFGYWRPTYWPDTVSHSSAIWKRTVNMGYGINVLLQVFFVKPPLIKVTTLTRMCVIQVVQNSAWNVWHFRFWTVKQWFYIIKPVRLDTRLSNIWTLLVEDSRVPFRHTKLLIWSEGTIHHTHEECLFFETGRMNMSAATTKPGLLSLTC